MVYGVPLLARHLCVVLDRRVLQFLVVAELERTLVHDVAACRERTWWLAVCPVQ
jgi:hypothetical protein